MIEGLSLLAPAVAGWLIGWVLLWRLPALQASSEDRLSPSGVAVVVPARDEAMSLPLLLADLDAHGAGVGEVVVVDDGSTDATNRLARRAGVAVVDGDEPPAGWAGKPWACWQGARATDASTLLFLDADLRLSTGAVAALLATHRRTGGLLSIAPQHRVRRAYEHLSMVPNLVSVMGSGAALPRPARRPVAFGPCLVTSRADYERVGGHEAVRNAILDDVHLGRRYAGAALPVTVLGGGALVGYRMYPQGIGSLVEGWSKNLAGGAASIPLWRALAVGLWVAGLLTPILLVADDWRLAAVAYVAYAVQQEILGRRVGRFAPGAGLAQPVLSVAFLALFLLAAVKLVVRRGRWKGRRLHRRP